MGASEPFGGHHNPAGDLRWRDISEARTPTNPTKRRDEIFASLRSQGSGMHQTGERLETLTERLDSLRREHHGEPRGESRGTRPAEPLSERERARQRSRDMALEQQRALERLSARLEKRPLPIAPERLAQASAAPVPTPFARKIETDRSEELADALIEGLIQAAGPALEEDAPEQDAPEQDAGNTAEDDRLEDEIEEVVQAEMEPVETPRRSFGLRDAVAEIQARQFALADRRLADFAARFSAIISPGAEHDADAPEARPQNLLYIERGAPASEEPPATRAESAPQQQPIPPDFDAERFLERLVERIDSLPRLERLEQGIAQLLGSLQDTTQASLDMADVAATRAAETTLAMMRRRPDDRLDQIEQALARLEDSRGDSERRAIEALDAVRQTLEHVAGKLNHVGAGSAGAAPLVAPEPPRAVAQRAHEAALRASIEVPSGAPSEAVSERSRFIAAVRRANQPQASEPKPELRPELKPAAFRAPPRPQAKAPRPKFTLDVRRRRRLLVGIAAVLFLLGSYGAAHRLLESRLGATEQPQTAGWTTEQTGAPADYHPPAEDPVAAVDLSTKTPTAQIATAEPLTPAPSTTSGTSDPAVTGSISPLSKESLPAEIGSSKLRTSALSGDRAAQYEVAMRYLDGKGVGRDSQRAADWFRYAASQGLAPAQYRLGSLYEKGIGVERDATIARGWYERAAESGNLRAMHNLGVMFAEGSLGKSDFASALPWFRKAAASGLRDSQYNLGVVYARGLGLKADLPKAYRWFALAANQGDADAAAKRDQIAEKLDTATLEKVKAEIAAWKPVPSITEANEVPAPPSGWNDQAATTARAPAPAKVVR